jgi:hypothetical protein
VFDICIAIHKTSIIFFAPELELLYERQTPEKLEIRSRPRANIAQKLCGARNKRPYLRKASFLVPHFFHGETVVSTFVSAPV